MRLLRTPLRLHTLRRRSMEWKNSDAVGHHIICAIELFIEAILLVTGKRARHHRTTGQSNRSRLNKLSTAFPKRCNAVLAWR